MFNKNTYMIPHGSSPSTSLLDVNGNEILLHHHDIFSGHYLAAAVCPPVDSAALFNQDIGEPSGTIQNSTCPRTPKRDRHSKIDTAQGPRDRRVRLSIGVARKFFDLQEMLGFDKPSKTLDWLLTKSKSSIKDLVHTKQQTNNPSTGGVVSSPSDECDAENDEYALDTEKDSKGKSVITSNNNNNNKLHCKGAAGSKDPAKESRVKARARARERTREKMCIKQLNETRNATSYCDLMNNNPLNNNNNNNSSTNIPIQYMNNQLEFCRISGSNNGKLCGAREQMMVHYPTSTNYEESAGGGDLIQESIVIKRKLKNNNNNNHHPPSILGFQPNLILSSSNYGVPFSGYNYYNATDQNWDVGGFNSSENLSAILDHHKFNNR
ncbi:hypothetical protein ACP275_11G112200 [Erythranthe tilingii]